MMTTPHDIGGRLVVDLGPEAGIGYFADTLPGKLYERQASSDRIPGLDAIQADLARLSGPVPAQVVPGTRGRDDFLRLYINGQYVLRLDASNNGRGYVIKDVFPLSLKDHDEIVRAEFALVALAWRLYGHPGDLPDDLDARWPAVKQAWHARPGRAGARGGAGTLPRHHLQYLDALDAIIAKDREIELSSTPADRMCRYQRIDPMAAQRRSAQSVYKFQLMGDSRLVAGTRVHIDEHPGLRGEIREVRESLITVRFAQAIDFSQVPRLGAFVASTSTVSFDKQAEAVEILRDGRARNPRLLEVLLDHRFLQFQPAAADPKDPLDDSQRAAFLMALAVPDLALVQGPPGTGKTRIIKLAVRELAAAKASGGAVSGPVLVSAYTNQAVDNVLKDLSEEALTVVRVGRGTTPACEHLTLEAQARGLQRRILDSTAPRLACYEVADPDTGAAVHRLAELAAELARLQDAVAREGQAQDAVQRHDAELTAVPRAQLAELAATLAALRAVAAERGRQAANAATRRDGAERRAATPFLGSLFTSGAKRLALKAGQAATLAEQSASEVTAAEARRAQVQSELDRIRAGDRTLATLRARLDADSAARIQQAERSLAAARRLASCLSDIATLPPAPADPAGLAEFAAAAERALEFGNRRLGLLRKWRTTLERRTEQLYPELIRYADVVGATCIGVASSEHLTGVPFDLAIIDEAGQIAAPSLLVPLVRASRAVLVGDHVQLPPHAAQQLADWATAQPSQAGSPALADLVTKSAFELLFPFVPAANRQTLNMQRRMPLVIGDFISRQFYGGAVGTDTGRPVRDELFASAMAFVDTAELPAVKRRERHPRPGESWKATSWVNDAEARLIADLVAYYDARKSDWVVIVPFSAQQGRISELLAQRLGDEERAAARVASVDSFQGGEHDTVIFGFTRSNPDGTVGFFSEVRRSNVALSRARFRMIMVGDLSTLTSAADPGFRSMMTALHDHVGLHGGLCGYRDVAARLDRRDVEAERV